ncbi:hypothetical protein MPSEU_000705500 [Mayamaea pseudoterrestris]|nr:hypothetical protein MPSEU_000705500 [Mayamaea pseudoterrestris]
MMNLIHKKTFATIIALSIASLSMLPTISAQTVDCGDGRCFNGGTCLTQDVNGATEYHCDCSATYGTNVAYAGRYCQYKATVFCPTNDGANVNLFCVNDGTCKSDPYEGCNCNDPYTGFVCEKKIPESQSGNDDGNYDTVSGKWPDPVDPTDDNVATAPAQSPSKTEATGQSSIIGDLVYQNHNDGDGSSGNSNLEEVQEGGYIGKVIYNNKDYLPDNNQDDDVIKETTMPPVNDIDICTTNGSTLDATPLSFCVNGGTCMRKVTTLQGHAGCECPDVWTGPHCEISIAIIEAAEAGAGPSVGKSFGVAVIVLATLAITALIAFGTVMYCKSRKRRRSTKTNARLRWGGPAAYSDDNSDINLAPRQQSFYEGDYPASTHVSSTRDPMAQFGQSHAAAAASMHQGSVDDGSARSEAEPQIYIGPPRDEDGHVLHSVEIL